MKSRKFKFRQTVLTQVTTQFEYKIKAKSPEIAVEKFKKLFEEKMGAGKEHLAIKKLRPEKSLLETEPVPVRGNGPATIVIELIDKKNKKQKIREIYDNKQKTWRVEDAEEENMNDEKDEKA